MEEREAKWRAAYGEAWRALREGRAATASAAATVIIAAAIRRRAQRRLGIEVNLAPPRCAVVYDDENVASGQRRGMHRGYRIMRPLSTVT